MDDDTRALLETAKAEVNEEKLAEAIASAFAFGFVSVPRFSHSLSLRSRRRL